MYYILKEKTIKEGKQPEIIDIVYIFCFTLSKSKESAKEMVVKPYFEVRHIYYNLFL